MVKTNPELFQHLFDQSPDFIQIFDFPGHCHYINNTAIDYFGYTLEWAIGRHVSDFVPGYKMEPTLWPERVALLRTAKTYYNVRAQIAADGELHDVEYFVNYAQSGGIEYVITIGKLISTSKRLKLERNKAANKKELSEEFLANMSHEFRSPLNNIIGFSNLLDKAGSLNLKQIEYLQYIQESSRTLLDMVNQILDFSKIEAGGISLALAPVDLIQLLNISLLSFSENNKNPHVQFKAELDSSIPPFVLADANRLKQILDHLLENAKKFTPKGEIKLSAELVNATPDESVNVKISVCDTGIGIAQDQMQSIFDAFTQGDSSSTRANGGTGLGLSIVKKLVELHETDIELESEIGKGSCFSFTINFKKSK